MQMALKLMRFHISRKDKLNSAVTQTRKLKIFPMKKGRGPCSQAAHLPQVHVLLISETKRREATNAKTQTGRLFYRINREYLQQQKSCQYSLNCNYHAVLLFKYIFDQNYVSLSHLVKDKRAWLIQSIHRHTSYWPSFPWNTTPMHVTRCKLR